jgi:FdhD protein
VVIDGALGSVEWPRNAKAPQGTPVHALGEDVGRHSALDKLGGALSHGGMAGRSGVLLLTSRVSVEMVQKAAAIDLPFMVAVSAPTALAVRTAEAAGLTLVAIARSDGFEVFTHPYRIAAEPPKLPSSPLPNPLKMWPLMSPDKLVYMANQIGKFFASQGEDQAVAGIANHLRKYWIHV